MVKQTNHNQSQIVKQTDHNQIKFEKEQQKKTIIKSKLWSQYREESGSIKMVKQMNHNQSRIVKQMDHNQIKFTENHSHWKQHQNKLEREP